MFAPDQIVLWAPWMVVFMPLFGFIVLAFLGGLAKKQGQSGRGLVEEALRMYLEIVPIAALDSEDGAESQTALLSRLQEIPDWTAHDACDAARSGGRS